MKKYTYHCVYSYNNGGGDCQISVDIPLENTTQINEAKDLIARTNGIPRNQLVLQNWILLDSPLETKTFLKFEIHTSVSMYLILAEDEFSAKLKFSSKYPSEKIRKILSSNEEVFEILGEE